MWVADADDGKVYAYSLATGSRAPSRDLNTLYGAGQHFSAGHLVRWRDRLGRGRRRQQTLRLLPATGPTGPAVHGPSNSRRGHSRQGGTHYRTSCARRFPSCAILACRRFGGRIRLSQRASHRSGASMSRSCGWRSAQPTLPPACHRFVTQTQWSRRARGSKRLTSWNSGLPSQRPSRRTEGCQLVVGSREWWAPFVLLKRVHCYVTCSAPTSGGRRNQPGNRRLRAGGREALTLDECCLILHVMPSNVLDAVRDFRGADAFGVRVVTPAVFLRLVEEDS